MGDGMEVTAGMDAGFSRRAGGRAVLGRLAGMGVTSIETYIRWIDVAPAADRWDWSVFDADLEAMRACGVRWVPFLIAGPWYATPAWFREGPRSVFARCLEHGRETGTQSIWSPHLFAEVQRLMAAFAEHYRPSDAIESLLLGVTGDYGEAIYTVTGNWPGDYHGHGGYWCGDPYAREDFRGWLRARYGELPTLGRAWGSTPADWAAIQPPASPAQAGSPRAWLDFVEWYRQAMTQWSARWLDEARRQLPETELYLCTGGDMPPTHGSDFSEQCRIAAAAGAGVRITNEGSDYIHNLMLTRLVASAGRHHGAFFGFEPASTVNPVGVAARQFNATGSGARQLHEYQPNILRQQGDAAAPVPGSTEAWERGRAFLVRRAPRPRVALLHSLPDLALRQDGILGVALPLAGCLRALCDFEVLDDHLVADGALDALRAVFLSPVRYWAPETVERLRAFARAGGIVVASGTRPASLEGPDTAGTLFGFAADTDALVGISGAVPVEDAPLPRYTASSQPAMGRSYRDLDPAARPLVRQRHTPARGDVPLVAWYRRWDGGIAVYFEGQFAAGGAPQALAADLLTSLPEALGMTPLPLGETPGVYETATDNATLAWNATDRPQAWRGQTLEPWGMGLTP